MSLLVQTLNNCMQIKVEALGHRQKHVRQVISSGTPLKVSCIFIMDKVKDRIIGNLIRVIFFEEVAVCWMINTVA